jgi:hypothetical protein
VSFSCGLACLLVLFRSFHCLRYVKFVRFFVFYHFVSIWGVNLLIFVIFHVGFLLCFCGLLNLC